KRIPVFHSACPPGVHDHHCPPDDATVAALVLEQVCNLDLRVRVPRGALGYVDDRGRDEHQFGWRQLGHKSPTWDEMAWRVHVGGRVLPERPLLRVELIFGDGE